MPMRILSAAHIISRSICWTIFRRWRRLPTVSGSTTAVPAETSYADSSFFDMFSFPLLSGSVEAWKASDRSAVISRSFADAHFPGRDPVGQTLTYNVLGEDEGYTFTIAAVMEDIDHSVIRYCDVMCRADFMTELKPSS